MLGLPRTKGIPQSFLLLTDEFWSWAKHFMGYLCRDALKRTRERQCDVAKPSLESTSMKQCYYSVIWLWSCLKMWSSELTITKIKNGNGTDYSKQLLCCIWTSGRLRLPLSNARQVIYQMGTWSLQVNSKLLMIAITIKKKNEQTFQSVSTLMICSRSF
jgi:hypothetical protein